jgi:hypothetical protein
MRPTSFGKVYNVSVAIKSREVIDDIYVVTAQATYGQWPGG